MALKKIARNGDTCGGAIISSATKTKVNGIFVALHGDAVTSHGTGLHAAATLIASTTTVKAEGKLVCRFGDSATCGHTISTASNDSFAGD